MRNANTGGDIPLVDGRTLPIKFRLEEGALAASCTNVSLDCVEQTAFPDRDNTILTLGKQAGTFIPAGALSQIVTVAIIENTTKPCIPPPFALPQYFPEPDQKGCYDFFTDPGPSIFNTTPDNPVKKSDRKSTRLNSSHITISYAVFCLKKKKSIACTISTSYRYVT